MHFLIYFTFKYHRIIEDLQKLELIQIFFFIFTVEFDTYVVINSIINFIDVLLQRRSSNYLLMHTIYNILDVYETRNFLMLFKLRFLNESSSCEN